MTDIIESHEERALRLVRQLGMARARDFTAAGIPLVYLKRLCAQGTLIQLGRGLYQAPELIGTHASHNLAEAAKLMPQGVISLLSALQHHQLSTQLPRAVWMTLPRGARASTSASFPLEVVHARAPLASPHIERTEIEGVAVPIYDVPKTVVDCFQHRRRVGLDVAIEALRNAINQRQTTTAAVLQIARDARMSNVMRPYVEALS